MTDNIHQTWVERTVQLIGTEALKRLNNAKVMVAGLGGVGGYSVEILARSSVGHLIIADADHVAESNINRQLVALHSTAGEKKTTLWHHRIADINPAATVATVTEFLTPDNLPGILAAHRPDFVIDAIDTVAPKCALIELCCRNRIHMISSMGSGGRLDPTRVRYGRLDTTAEDGLARAVRQRLKSRLDLRRIKVVWSDEAPRKSALLDVNTPNKRTSFGTLATIPAVFGLLLANHVILRLIE